MTLHDEFQYYLNHQKELAAEYGEGTIIAIKDHRVLGTYATEIDAVRDLAPIHALGTFLVQRVSADPESHVHTFHSQRIGL